MWKIEIVGEKETSPKGTLTTPPLNPEADGVTLPSSDIIYAGKDKYYLPFPKIKTFCKACKTIIIVYSENYPYLCQPE